MSRGVKFVVIGNQPGSRSLVFVDSHGSVRFKGNPKVFRSEASAAKVARKLRSRPHLHGFDFRVARAVTKNPSGLAKARDSYLRSVDEAADRFERFTGYPATKEKVFKQAPIKSGFALGALVSVTYEQNREGDGLSHYKHDFAKKNRPLLVSSSDGSLLGIVGGQYRVTDRGIEDS